MRKPRLGPGAKLVISAAILGLLFALLPWAQVRSAAGRISPGLWAGVGRGVPRSRRQASATTAVGWSVWPDRSRLIKRRAILRISS